MSETDYRKLYDSLAPAVERLERQNDFLRDRVLALEAEKKQWELEKVKQQAIIQQALASANETSNRYLEENRELRKERDKA